MAHRCGGPQGASLGRTPQQEQRQSQRLVPAPPEGTEQRLIHSTPRLTPEP